jgi:hypothetical protein
VTDQLFLSIWLEQRGPAPNRTRQFEKMLQTFPFSQREQPQSIISILAVDTTEPPLLERPINGPIDVAEVMETLRDYAGTDVAYELETWWDLWLNDGTDWKLGPSRILLSCYGPDFDNGTEESAEAQEDLRIDFGVDAHYLPDPDVPGSGKMVEANVKSLLRLVHEIDATLPIQKRSLQTESGQNFAERLQHSIESARDLG